MPRRNVDWDRRLGRQLKLRDLHVLFAVAQFGSMAKAAAHFSVTQPAISQAIADLERAVGVRLVDRGPHGCSNRLRREAAEAWHRSFDALKLGMREVCALLDDHPLPVAPAMRCAQDYGRLRQIRMYVAGDRPHIGWRARP
jgi:molybdenum-dependent DNA-binding transcriptional regulator ModE